MLIDIEDHDDARAGRPRVVRMVDWDSDYPDQASVGCDKHCAAVLEFILANRIQICGRCHQGAPRGAPQFADGTVWRESMKNWGVTMAEAWDRAFGGAMWGYVMAGCWQCRDDITRHDWDTWSGPLPPPVVHPPVDPAKVMRFGFDAMAGCHVIRPELAARLVD